MTNTIEELNAAESAMTIKRSETAVERRKEYIADDALRLEFKEYVTRHKLTHKKAGEAIYANVTQVTKYLNNNADFFVKRIEDNIRDFLRHAAVRELYRAEIFPTSVTRQVNGVIESMRKANQVGLIHGDAGWGKTSGIKLYLGHNALAVAVEVFPWLRGLHGQIRLLWEASKIGDREHGEMRIEAMVRKFRKSERPIIVDNAHLLTRGGLQFWSYFRDATGVPIIFVGNHEIVAALRKNDQMFSRLGPGKIVQLDSDEYTEVARRLIGQALKQEVPELEPLAADTIAKLGHLRSLWNQLTIARELKEAKPESQWTMCFRAAGNTMIRNQEEMKFAPGGKTITAGTNRR